MFKIELKGGTKMKKGLGYLLTAIAVLASSAASMGCMIIFSDEPTAPKSMID